MLIAVSQKMSNMASSFYHRMSLIMVLLFYTNVIQITNWMAMLGDYAWKMAPGVPKLHHVKVLKSERAIVMDLKGW